MASYALNVLGEEQPIFLSTAELFESCNGVLSASRFEQVRVLRQWLLPILRKHIIRWITIFIF
jgi:hypothetical protein